MCRRFELVRQDVLRPSPNGILAVPEETVACGVANQEIRQVVEGVLAAKAVRKVAEDKYVVMPICEEIYRILYEGVSPREAVSSLMGRALKPE